MARRTDQPDRRELLLDETLAIVAEGGLAAVTHRAVERAAGVPHGSVTYHFGTRDDLIDALVERMVATCAAQVSQIAHSVSMALAAPAARGAGEGLDVDAVTRALIAWMDGTRQLQLARLELELAGARDPRLGRRMTDAARIFWRMCEPIVLAMGSTDPELDARAMSAAIDGLLLDHLAHEPVDPAVVRVGVRQLLRSWAPGPGA